jgi:hypothetical protein
MGQHMHAPSRFREKKRLRPSYEKLITIAPQNAVQKLST